MTRQPPINDSVIVAYYDLRGNPVDFRFDFQGLPLGSRIRSARCAEYRRLIDALKGQGCEVHVWDLHCWSNMNYRGAFYNKTLIGSKWRTK